MKCLCSGEQLRGAEEILPSSESLATKDYTGSGFSSRPAEIDQKPDTGNIEEAESSLRESGSLNYEEARALLGRYEYKKGNVEAALHVFEGINISVVAPNMKLTLSRIGERRKRRSSQNNATPPMSIHTVSLLLEAIYLKGKSLEALRRFKEAAQSCKVILDIVESSLPKGLPPIIVSECKMQETVNKAVELLPELWKLADSSQEAILSYRRALLHHWNLDAVTMAKIQKEFAVFLLYSGGEASPPNLMSQMDSAFVPRNNIEEAILLLMILLRKISLNLIGWDPSILEHLTYALSVTGELKALANQVEELLPELVDRKERSHMLALCYYGAGEDLTALNLLRLLLSSREDPNNVPALLLSSKICGENGTHGLAEEGIMFARRALANLPPDCDQIVGTANYLLGVSLSIPQFVDSEQVIRQAEALQAFETSGKMTKLGDATVVYHLSKENAQQRKLDAALYYAKILLKLEGGCDVKGWLLLAQILSAQKRFADAEVIINAALDQTGKWDQGLLLKTKAKLQIAQGQLKQAIETYTQLLALLQVQNKNFGSGKMFLKGSAKFDRSLELEIWNDLSRVYVSLAQWGDAEICISRCKAINPYSGSGCHATGLLLEAKGALREAFTSYRSALDIDPNHVPSLISIAMVLKRLGDQSPATSRSFLRDALRLDKMNHSAWYNLGLIHKDEGSVLEAAECFIAAASLEETAPVEPFR